MFNKIGKFLTRERDHNKAMDAERAEAESFQPVPEKGLPYYLKFALFVLFGYYNARLFYHAVPNWRGVVTAIVALGAEGLALYCLTFYTHATGNHKKVLGAFGLLLSAFSLTHATLSFFQLERSARWGGTVEYYAEVVAFPLLFGLLFIACVTIYLTHPAQAVHREQAEAQMRIRINRARLVADGVALRDEAQLEQERLLHVGEQIRMEGEYLAELEKLVTLKEKEQRLIDRITDPALREQIARELGLTEGGKGQRPALRPGFASGRKDSDDDPKD